MNLTESIVPDIFFKLSEGYKRQKPLKPRSIGDKEYFPQDWFFDQANDDKLVANGRNAYPDFTYYHDIKLCCEGFEVKSLAVNNGVPSRKDVDFNSTIPGSPIKDMSFSGIGNTFLVFFLYENTEDEEIKTVHSLSVAHMSLINDTPGQASTNRSIPNFGSYNDGLLRNRKMYVFPHPITIHPDNFGKCQLIVPSSWELDDRFVKTGDINRRLSNGILRNYSVDMDTDEISANYIFKSGGRKTNSFHVYEVKE